MAMYRIRVQVVRMYDVAVEAQSKEAATAEFNSNEALMNATASWQWVSTDIKAIHTDEMKGPACGHCGALDWDYVESDDGRRTSCCQSM